MAPPKPAEDRATALLKDRIRRLFRELPGAIIGEEEPVHQLRIAGRRLRVALPLLAGMPGGRRVRRVRRALRGLTRAAGSGRDLDVLVTLFEDRLAILDPPSAAQREILRRLRVARTRARRGMIDGLSDLRVGRLRRDLRAVRSRGPADVFTILARARLARQRDALTLRRGLLEVGERYDPEALHSLRRLVRRLRYTGEVEDAIRGQDTGAGPVWKVLQDSIGVLHDVHLLSSWLGDLAASADREQSRDLAAVARREQEAFRAEGQRLHTELLRTRPAQTVARALDAMERGRPAA
jgi:CHAD domain-containing protein